MPLLPIAPIFTPLKKKLKSLGLVEEPLVVCVRTMICPTASAV
ncbi:MAG: hypothetical protein QFC78_08775 [Pseudomonadota bacterium]|nr:hypothetical protein [Pseudomonadota bacterium]